MSTNECQHCGSELLGPVCHQCGQRIFAERWTAAGLLGQLARYLSDIEEGFLHTALELLRRPAKVVSDYWRGRTVCYYEPFRYAVIWTALGLLVNFWFGIDDILQAAIQPDAIATLGEERLAAADQRFDSWINLLALALIPVNALTTFLLFRRHKRTYGEHLILAAFVTGELALISCFTQMTLVIAPSLVAAFLLGSLALGIVYNAYTLMPLFGEGLPRTVLKATVQSIVGVTVYGGLVAAGSALAVAITGS